MSAAKERLERNVHAVDRDACHTSEPARIRSKRGATDREGYGRRVLPSSKGGSLTIRHADTHPKGDHGSRRNGSTAAQQPRNRRVMKADDPRKTSKREPWVESSPPLEFCGHCLLESHRVMLYATAREPASQIGDSGANPSESSGNPPSSPALAISYRIANSKARLKRVP